MPYAGLFSQDNSDPNSGLREAISGLSTPRARFGAEAARFRQGVETADKRGIARLGGRVSAQLARNFAPTNASFAGALGDATRRSRARSGVQNRGEAAVRNQQLRDRIEIARAGRTRQGKTIDALGAAANIREGVNIGLREAKGVESASRAGAFGTLAGSAAAYLGNRYSTNNTLQEIDMSSLPGPRGE